MKQLADIYNRATDYIAGKDIDPIAILGDAADIYIKYGAEMPEELIDIFSHCVLFINKDFDKPMRFDEYIDYGDELIEDLCGTIGKYLNNYDKTS